MSTRRGLQEKELKIFPILTHFRADGNRKKQRFLRPGAACPLLRLRARVRSPSAQGLGAAGRLLFYQGLASQPFGAEMEQNRYARDGAEEAEQGRKARALHHQSPHHGKKPPAA